LYFYIYCCLNVGYNGVDLSDDHVDRSSRFEERGPPMKRSYERPQLVAMKLEMGVFGDYSGGGGDDGGCGGGSWGWGWGRGWGWWWR
jgi:hypothetical protein